MFSWCFDGYSEVSQPGHISPWVSLTQRNAPLFQVAAEDSFLSLCPPRSPQPSRQSCGLGPKTVPPGPFQLPEHRKHLYPLAIPHSGTRSVPVQQDALTNAVRLPLALQISTSTATATATFPSIIPQPLCSWLRNTILSCPGGTLEDPLEAPCTRLRFQSSITTKVEGRPSAWRRQHCPIEVPSLLSSWPPLSGRRFEEFWERSLGHFPCRSP